MERSAARRRPGPRDGLPSGDRPRRHLERRPAEARRGGDLHRGAREVPRCPDPPCPDGPRDADDAAGTDRRPHLLVTEHQHLSGPPMGARAGDLRRGPLPHRPHGRRVRGRDAGQRSQLPQGRRHAQALCGAQRAGAGAARLRRQGERGRHGRHVPAGLPRHCRRGQGGVGHVRLQRGERNPWLRQRRPAAGAPARAVGLRGLRRQRLRRGRRHLPEPQVHPVHGRGGRGGGEGRHRSHLRHRVQDAGRRSGGRQDLRSGDRSCRGPPVRCAIPARHVRSARARAVLEDPRFGRRLGRASAACPRRRQGGHRPAEERGSSAAPGRLGPQDRGRGGRRPTTPSRCSGTTTASPPSR